MRAAEEFQQATPRLFHWEIYEPKVKTDLSSSAVITDAGLFFIDPIPLKPEPLEALVTQARPAGVILTNGNHERGAREFTTRFQVPLFAHPEAAADLQAAVPEPLDGCTKIAGEITVIPIPGGGPGEVALHFAVDRGLIILGDAVINLASHGFALLPEKYCADHARMTESLRKLLQYQFEVMTFAHGLPITSGAHQRLQALLT